MIEWSGDSVSLFNPAFKCIINEEIILEIAESINFDVRNYISAF